MIAKLVFPIPLDKEFDYIVPEEFAADMAPGRFVIAPFGRRSACGLVTRLADRSSVPGLKAIQDPLVSVPPLSANLLRLASFVSRYYLCSLGEAVFSMTPSWLSRKSLYLLSPRRGAAERLADMPLDAEKRLLAKLIKQGHISFKSLSPAARALRRARLIKIEEKLEMTGLDADDTQPRELRFGQGPKLTVAQRRVVDELLSPAAEAAETFLLHGVTAAGKTEVYLRVMESVLRRGQDVIFLVPEISLTPQIGGWIEERFGAAVIPFHSGLANKERRHNWLLAARGQGRVVVGARSALFAPLPKLGLIVVDEEPEGAYKQEDAPRYNARDLAVVRGGMEKAQVILGSATPAVESYYNCSRGNYRLLEMPSRVDDRRPPRIEVVDLRRVIGKSGVASISHPLKQAIGARLEKGEQTLLFLNRRGYATSLVCAGCGEVIRCRDCALSLVYHRQEEKLRCHYCAYQLDPPTRCPDCGGERLIRLGAGTERVAEELTGLFPRARIRRLDVDIGRRRGAYEETFSALRQGEIDILIGTQIIAKGLDFPEVTLVGVVLADVALNLPDFRSSERTYQLITQVGGRAGRGKKDGLVIVQTYSPEHYSVQTACHAGYSDYYMQELAFRREHNYPPFCRLVNILFLSRRATAARDAAAGMKRRLASAASRQGLDMECLGPSPAYRACLKGQYRYQLIFKFPRQGKWHQLLRQVVLKERAANRLVDIKVDVDPLSLL